MTRHHWHVITGFGCLAFALIVLFAWIPLDVDSGVIERVRRQTVIGDAMAPTIWAIGLAILGLLLGIGGLLETRRSVDREPGGGPTLANLRYLGLLLAIIVVSLVVMMVAGPTAVELAQWAGSGIDSYRTVRAEVPWKYTGYVLGGFCLVFGLMSYIVHQPGWRLALIALVVVIAMALFYDLPFKNLLLPPNGDQ